MILMRLSKLFLIFAFFTLCASCGTKTRIYYWEKAGTGANRFILWPWTWAQLANSPETLDLHLRLSDGGIWANFSPYTGAQPVFVNSASPTTTVIYSWYADCMEEKGYKERRPYTGPMSLVE